MKKFILIIAFFYSFYVVGQNENRPFYAEVIGKGTPIVLIPGFTVSGEVWHPLVTELQKNMNAISLHWLVLMEKIP